MHLRLRIALALVLSVSVVATAQDAPTLTAEQRAILQNIDLRAENLTLKMAALQAEFVKLQAEASAYAATLKRDGFTLQRGEDGSWRYVPAKEPTP